MLARIGTPLAVALAQSGVSTPIRLLEAAGPFHGNEVPPIAGTWFGLGRTEGGFAWRGYRVTETMVPDPVIDTEGKMTAKQITAEGPPPVFLAQGLPFREGRVASAFWSDSPLSIDYGTNSVTIGLGNQAVTVTLEHAPDHVANPRQRERLVLESRGIRQVLMEWPDGRFDAPVSLIWAGDLDRDGKLDLYMNLSDHYNVSNRTLLLSARAARGDIVTQVAVWSTTGC